MAYEWRICHQVENVLSNAKWFGETIGRCFGPKTRRGCHAEYAVSRAVWAMSDVVRVEVGSAVVAYRPAAGERRCVSASDVSSTTLFRAVPWRTFRWYFGQRHYSGWYWAAT